MDITRWSTLKSNWLCSLQPKMEKLYIVKNKQTNKQDQELTVAQIMNSLLPNSDLNWRKWGKPPFRYDLNQIPYDYTVEVRNSFKGLDLTDRVPDELWMEVHDIVQETGIKTIPMEKKCKSRKSRNTWSNRQIWPWSTEWTRAKANRVLPRECTGHSKHPLPTTQNKTLHMDITRWSTPKSDWLYSLQPKMEKLYTVIENKTGSWLWLRS